MRKDDPCARGGRTGPSGIVPAHRACPALLIAPPVGVARTVMVVMALQCDVGLLSAQVLPCEWAPPVALLDALARLALLHKAAQ